MTSFQSCCLIFNTYTSSISGLTYHLAGTSPSNLRAPTVHHKYLCLWWSSHVQRLFSDEVYGIWKHKLDLILPSSPYFLAQCQHMVNKLFYGLECFGKEVYTKRWSREPSLWIVPRRQTIQSGIMSGSPPIMVAQIQTWWHMVDLVHQLCPIWDATRISAGP